jgi:hypothetical protein
MSLEKMFAEFTIGHPLTDFTSIYFDRHLHLDTSSENKSGSTQHGFVASGG